jgi:pimeloyl-ACP methyl ester carboxylesterase
MMKKLMILMCAFTLTLLGGSASALASHSSRAGAEELGVKNGAQYAMFLPGNWNGRLVLYAHGFVDPAYPIALPDVLPPDVASWVVELRETLLGSGYAVAYSSYSENGWAVKDGADRTHELRDLFRNRFGVPRGEYIVGRSLGALITVFMAERYSRRYEGALALCGPVGGGLVQTDYIGHVRVLFDYFFPGVIPGDAVNVPPLDYSPGSPLVNAIVGAIATDPQAAQALAAVDQINLPYLNFGELINSIVRPLGYNIRGTNDLLARTRGESPFGNVKTKYSVEGKLDQALKRGVQRFVADWGGIEYLNDFYRPEGDLAIPLLTLHTTADPDVPFSHQTALAEIVAKAGKTRWLVQQHVQRYGHCNFSPAEVAEALSRLVEWSERSVKPASGDVTP